MKEKAALEQVGNQFLNQTVDFQSLDDWMSGNGYESISGDITDEDFLQDSEMVFPAEDGKTVMRITYCDTEYNEEEDSCYCVVNGVYEDAMTY